MVAPLSRRQWAVFEVILTAAKANLEPPSVRAIARSLDISHHTVQVHLEALHRKGWLACASPDGLRCSAPPGR